MKHDEVIQKVKVLCPRDMGRIYATSCKACNHNHGITVDATRITITTNCSYYYDIKAGGRL